MTQLISNIRGANKWIRPADWLQITKPGLTEEKIVLLCAVFPDLDNALALKISTSAGDYTVDWGDGSTPTTHASASQADRVLDYSALAGTESVRGYRQCLVTITPTTSGAGFRPVSNVTLIQRPAGWSASTNVVDGVLEIYASFPTATGVYGTFDSATLKSPLLEYIWVNAPSITSAAYSFRSNLRLSRIDFAAAWTSQVDLNTTFTSCTSLIEINYPGGIEALFSAASNLGTTFAGCSALQLGDSIVVPAEKLNASTFNTAGQVARKIQIVGTLPVTATTLQSLVSLTTGQAVRLEELSIADARSTHTNISNLAANQLALRALSITGDLSGITSTSSAFSGVTNLRSLVLTGLRVGFTISHNRLGATALNALFTSLGTANGAQTVTVTGNPGAATCDTSIATAKGWTVAV